MSISSVRVKDDRVLVQARSDTDIAAAHHAIGGLTAISDIARNGSMHAFGFAVQPHHSAATYLSALGIEGAAAPAIGNLLNQAIVVAKTKEALVGFKDVQHEAAHAAPDQFVANVAERLNSREPSGGIV